MSLFSAQSGISSKIIDPSQVEIEGEIIGSFFAGRIEMKFPNQSSEIDVFKLFIGKNKNNKICLHDFQVKIDENLLNLKVMEVNQAKEIFDQETSDDGQAVFGFRDDSYASIDIPNIFLHQIVTISANFDMSVTFTSASSIGVFFPLTYPGIINDEVIKCANFKFSLNFRSLQLKEDTISSNPEGKIDFQNFTYIIDKLEPSLTTVSVMINVNLNAQIGVAQYCGKYGSLMLIPSKGGKEEDSCDHSGEEFIFIVDCSESMNGREIKLAAQCLIFFIKSLPEKCYFNVVCFGSNFIPLFERPVSYTDENASTALQLAQGLKANLKGTVLSQPLSYVFSKSLSETNKLRRVFVLTDGCVFDPSEVISIVGKNASNTMSSAIGIGYGVDQELVKGIGRAGKGFVDFVPSEDDMWFKVINQLAKSLNGSCKVDISIENDDSFEIQPPLSYHQFWLGIPATVYFRSTKEFDDNTHIIVNVEGNSEQQIVQMKTLKTNSRAEISLEYLFNNENIKYLRNLEQTEEVVSAITQLSIRYGVLSSYTGLIGKQECMSKEAKARIKSLIEYENQNKFEILVKTLTGKKIKFFVKQSDKIEDVKAKIMELEGIPLDQQKLIFSQKLMKEGNTLQDYGITKNETLHLAIGKRASARTKQTARLITSGVPPRRTVGAKAARDNANLSNISRISDELLNVKIKNLIYALNDEERTAKLIGNETTDENVSVPVSILYDNNEYIITCVSSGSFKGSKTIKSVQFPLDSEVQIIEKDAFTDSSIEKLFIPSKVSVLEVGWCSGTPNLTDVIIVPNNLDFMYLDNQMIIRKENGNSESFDMILFVRRDAKKVEIPSFIDLIASFSFENTGIEKISIPSNVTYIGKRAFASCKKLQQVEIQPDSKLRIIEKDAFENTSIQNVPTLPNFH